ncbi:hypothetical protein HDF16_000200 [Granulicella aggregans]|uniref:Uncharacterized protein n=1 Tax=Granulicella aggregans TaxID=474949 RepID=A0A7W8E1Q6_9BACT|nr:hypothetical protein [Granulicella aggregans]MBB5055531.1 hypothetical protein [Granulicella aggregans]
MKSAKILKGTVLAFTCAMIPIAIAPLAGARTSKPIVPTYVLQAHTVAVVIDPDAGMSLDNPQANETARKDVETALANWGRFTTVLGPEQADLVIVLRKGNEKAVSETVPAPRQNSRPGVITPTQDGIGIGGQQGQQPGGMGGAGDGPANGTRGSAPQLEVGKTDDSFIVYAGNVDHPLDGNAGWRWVRREGLHSHDVPAVVEFRKAIEEAEKQAAKQGKHP